MAASGAIRHPDGVVLTKESNLTFTATGGNATATIGQIVNDAKPTNIAGDSGSFEVELTKEGTNVIIITYTDSSGPLCSTPFLVKRDTVGPELKNAEVIESPTTGSTLVVTFAEDDLPNSIDPNAFVVARKSKQGDFDDSMTVVNAIADGRRVRLPFSSLPAGEYQLTVKGVGEKVLVDRAGNHAGGHGDSGQDQRWPFVVVAERMFGEHVEFTPYAPPTKQVPPPEGFNPGDYVETRVARLFYFRDAHRVAEIVNRNIRSYNRSAVTQAERRAEMAREDAEEATDERREQERAAVRAAEQARAAEQQLAQAQQTLAVAQNLESDIREDRSERESLSEDSDRYKQLTRRIQGNQEALNSIGSPEILAAKVNSMQQSVANLRQVELVRKEAWEHAEAKEARLRAAQFRHEVTAAKTDPDTYVAGKMDSQDPVTQCSLSVIGEGLIQIRGPIKGINKIRTMINQIDSPVGQIKVGIFTVQIN
ncbi:MAG: hypothetical protein ACF788_05910, partial [Novipirellula sp. JB048]